MPRETSIGIERVCIQCEKIFKIWASDLKVIKGKYCSNRCQLDWQGHPDRVLEKFWKFVEINPETGCWEWAGGKNDAGYGIFCTSKMRIRTHRYCWELFNEPIPQSMELCHKCDSPPCINPDHLFIGTHAENMADMAQKRRGTKMGRPGEQNPAAKLTEEIAREIFAMKGQKIARVVADIFNVGTTAVYHIWHGHTWKHLNLLAHNDSSNTTVPVSNVCIPICVTPISPEMNRP